MSTLFDESGGQPKSLFAPVKTKSDSKSKGPKPKQDSNLPSLFSAPKKTLKRVGSSKPKPKPTPNESTLPAKQESEEIKGLPEIKGDQNTDKKSNKKKDKKEKKERKEKREKIKTPDNQEEIQENVEETEQNETVEAIPVDLPPKKTRKSRPKQKKVVKKVVVRRKNTQDIAKRTLNHIQLQITEGFNELFSIVEGLSENSKSSKPQNLQKAKEESNARNVMKPEATLSNDDILFKLQEAISDSLDKDRTLQMKQISIKNMTTTFTLSEQEEKTQLRKKIADLMETIAAETANTADAQSEHEFRAQEISRLHIELENIPKTYAATEKKLREELNVEIRTAQEEYERVRRSCDLRIKEAEEKVRSINQQIILEGTKMAQIPTQADLRRAVERSKQELKDVVENYGNTFLAVLSPYLSKNKTYSGANVRQAVMIALKKAMNKVLNPDQKDDEDEDENENGEEEEEAENVNEEEEEEAENQGEEEEEEAEQDDEDENNEEEDNNVDEEEAEAEEEVEEDIE